MEGESVVVRTFKSAAEAIERRRGLWRNGLDVTSASGQKLVMVASSRSAKWSWVWITHIV